MTEFRSKTEGDIYKTITVADRTFVIRYGFYSDAERLAGEPIPILPDFEKNPLYDRNGMKYVTQIQDPCEHYQTYDGLTGDGWCADCIFYPNSKDEIGICQCEKNKNNQ